MSKHDRDGEYRLQGLEFAYRLAKAAKDEGKDPVEELLREVKFRRPSGVTTLTSGELMTQSKFLHDSDAIKAYTMKTMLAVAVAVYMEETNCTQEEAMEFMKTYNRYADGLVDGAFGWTDILDMVHADTGITLDLPDEILREIGHES